MSTLRTNAINNISASVGGITIDSSGTVSGSLPSPNRNLLYNGAFQINQRGTSTTGITSGGYYTADRWCVFLSALGTWTQDIQADAPTGSGFRNSLRMLCTTADAAPAASDQAIFFQRLEGQDLQRIRKGTASAQRLTLSFWVKSNVTGTYIAELSDLDNSRNVSAAYTINASATWERKIISFPADTTGVFTNDNGASLDIYFHLADGSNFTSGGSLQNTWGTGSTSRAVGQTNLASAINNSWQITGVQLETGDATDFEFKSFGQELRECQRYYQRAFVSLNGIGGSGTANIGARHQFNVPMRSTAVNTANTFVNTNAGTTIIDGISDIGFRAYASVAANAGFELGWDSFFSAEL